MNEMYEFQLKVSSGHEGAEWRRMKTYTHSLDELCDITASHMHEALMRPMVRSRDIPSLYVYGLLLTLREEIVAVSKLHPTRFYGFFRANDDVPWAIFKDGENIMTLTPPAAEG